MGNSWNVVPLELPANKEYEHIVTTPGANVIYVVNNSEFTIYVDLNKAATDNYEEVAPGQGKAVLVRKSEIKSVKLYATGEAYVVLHEIEEVDTRIFILLQSINGEVVVTSSPGLKAAELNIDGDKDLQVDIKTMPEMTVATMPGVDIDTMPEITGGTWAKVTFTGAETKTVKETPGRIFIIAVEGAINVYPQNDSTQCWKTGAADFGERGLVCATSIKLTSDGAGVAWVLYI